MNDLTKSKEAHLFAAKALSEALKTFQKSGVSAEIAIQALLSVGTTLLISSCGAEDAARTLEGMAAAIRRGDITRDGVKE